MDYKIIVDSSSNLSKDFLKDTDIGFDIAPLTIRIEGKEYVDDGSVTVEQILKALDDSKSKSSSSCPSPDDYLKRLTGATHYIIVTISSKLSGSYNSALVARDMYEHKENVIVIDSFLVCGAMQIIVRKAKELIESKVDFKDMEALLNKERDSNNLLFVLNKFDSFVKNGRINKLVAFFASKLLIKPLCAGENGTIVIKEKVRTIEGVLKRLAINIGNMCPNTEGRICVISHTDNLKGAEWLKETIKEKYKFKEVIIEDNKVLCSYYALSGGIIVSF